MKFKKPRNKKTKLHIKFDENDRRDYLLGFRKRKLERKEKAKVEMAEMVKKEKREIKKKRMELIYKMIGANTNQFDSESDDEEEDKAPADENEKTAVTEYDNCTVEVSDLNLDNKFALGTKKNSNLKGASCSKDHSEEEQQQTSLFKVPTDKIKNKKFKTSIWKSATKKAKKSFEFEKRNKKKKKKKVLVTEL